jgi:predicted transcriptional regulator YdeE
MKKPEPMATNDPDAEKYAKFTQPLTGPVDNKMFQEYGKHTNEMLKTAQINQNRLLGVIDKLFIFRINPKTKEKEISINPELTDEKLDQITEETRNLIISLYIKCEQDFQKGLTMFEAIVTEQMRLTAERRIIELNKQKEKLEASLPPVSVTPTN